ncbi:MAG: Npt1/Npt2 family nucleotide transporter [bacterium]
MLPKPLRALWGDLSNEELKKFGILSTAIMLILGNYWMLRTTKNAVFDMFVGFREWQPIAKIFSLVAMIFIVLAYSKLVDLMKKQHLLYFFCILYGFSFFLVGHIIAHPGFGSLNTDSFLFPFVSWIPGKAIGWISYVLLESYGSLVVAIFYSFVASVMTTESAKKGYGMMAFIIQIGTITGSFITMEYAQVVGISKLYTFGSIIILLVPFIIMFYLKVIPTEKPTPKQLKKEKLKLKTGFFEGLKILITRPYVIGIFVVATGYEAISTILEYQMNWIATGIYLTPAKFATFTAYQAIGINTVALLFALIGTSFFMRRFGLKFCIMSFPILIGFIVSGILLTRHFDISSYQLMWLMLGSVVAIKGLNYAFNKPSMEVLYIPTSNDIKFKSKGWIDTFGSRSTKGIGAAVSNTFKHSLPNLLFYGSIISLGIVGVWTVTAAITGNKFQKLNDENETID